MDPPGARTNLCPSCSNVTANGDREILPSFAVAISLQIHAAPAMTVAQIRNSETVPMTNSAIVKPDSSNASLMDIYSSGLGCEQSDLFRITPSSPRRSAAKRGFLPN